MTESMPPGWNPAPSGPATPGPAFPTTPNEAAAPAGDASLAGEATPVKRSRHVKIGAIVIGVVLVVAVSVRIVLDYLEDRRWKVGACVDYYPNSPVEFDVDPHIVDCAGSAARSRIAGIAEPGASCESRGWFATVNRDGKTYCLIQT